MGRNQRVPECSRCDPKALAEGSKGARDRRDDVDRDRTRTFEETGGSVAQRARRKGIFELSAPAWGSGPELCPQVCTETKRADRQEAQQHRPNQQDGGNREG
jgi:hypothetical protein